MSSKPRITIEFCTQCNWMLRAAEEAQNLLRELGDNVGEVALIPGSDGVYIVRSDEQVIWNRKVENSFPETDELVKRIRSGSKS